MVDHCVLLVLLNLLNLSSLLRQNVHLLHHYCNQRRHIQYMHQIIGPPLRQQLYFWSVEEHLVLTWVVPLQSYIANYPGLACKLQRCQSFQCSSVNADSFHCVVVENQQGKGNAFVFFGETLLSKRGLNGVTRHCCDSKNQNNL